MTDSGATMGMSGTYNENSDPQLAIIELMTPSILLGIDELECSSSAMIIADFGASHGRNSIVTMKRIIKYLRDKNKLVSPLLVVHNDLPTNDWPRFFQLLSQEKSYQGAANACSFYEQCLPENSLTFGLSSSSINWLSKIPCHIRHHCFYIYAEEDERQAFARQAKIDFDTFIEYRSRELVRGGIFALSVPCLSDQGMDSVGNYFNLLYATAQSLFSEEELLHYTVPIYFRTISECIDNELFRRCSLELIKASTSPLHMSMIELYRQGQITLEQIVKGLTKSFQSTMEPLINKVLVMHGRSNDEIAELSKKFWLLYEEKLKEQNGLYLDDDQYVFTCLIFKKL